MPPAARGFFEKPPLDPTKLLFRVFFAIFARASIDINNQLIIVNCPEKRTANSLWSWHRYCFYKMEPLIDNQCWRDHVVCGIWILRCDMWYKHTSQFSHNRIAKYFKEG